MIGIPPLIIVMCLSKLLLSSLLWAYKSQGQSLKLKIVKTPWLSDSSCEEKAKSAKYYANAELFNVELEN